MNEAPNDSARVSGQDRKIPLALGTNQIAGFGGFRPRASLEKNKVPITDFDSEGNFYFLERQSPSSSKFLTMPSTYKFVRSSCECDVLDRRLPRINDSKSLQAVESFLERSRVSGISSGYWTSLR